MTSGPVEEAIRKAVRPGQAFGSIAQCAPFTVGELNRDGLVLLLGQGHRTLIPWNALEGVPSFLRGGEWLRVGSIHASTASAGTFDGYLKQFTVRSAGSYVPVVLEAAGVVELDRGRPNRVRLRKGWA